MMHRSTASFTVDFGDSGRRRDPSPGSERVPRVVRVLALAHRIDADIHSGIYTDLADAARKLGLSRARVTQIVNLTLLAPAIQEEILAMTAVRKGRERITERALRQIVAEADWNEQLRHWRQRCRT